MCAIVRYQLCLFVVEQVVAELSESLTPASLVFDAQGVPFSAAYGDIYRPNANPLAQAHHVFLRGNGLPGRWQGKTSFTVCETGFGLGHNFLALWQAWREDPDRCARLHVVSFEAHPFSPDDMARYVQGAFAGETLARGLELARAWPVPLPGVHRLEFEQGALTLTVLFGPVERMARQASARADAFFLDGFSPRVNPAMWSPALFSQLVRLATPGATAATWCTAGHVRRALQDSGFLVQREPGYGPKRHMTTARLRDGLGQSIALCSGALSVAVVGAGIASAGIVHALVRRGHQVTVVDPVLGQGLGGTHKGHRAVAVSPQFNKTDDIKARLSRAGVLRSAQVWQQLAPGARPRVCGTLYPARTVQDVTLHQAALKKLALPVAWVCWLDPLQARARVGVDVPYGGVWFPFGQQVFPEPLLAAVFGAAGVTCLPVRVAALQPGAAHGWSLLAEDGRVLAQADRVILANALGAGRLLETVQNAANFPRLANATPLAGEVYDYPAYPASPPAAIIAGNGYWLPAVNGYPLVGSTYRRHGEPAPLTQAGRDEVFDKVRALVPASSTWLAPAGVPSGAVSGWSGWRASVPDRLPVIGPVSGLPGLWVAAAYASRGFTWSALAGDLLAADWFHEPLPLERELMNRLAVR